MEQNSAIYEGRLTTHKLQNMICYKKAVSTETMSVALHSFSVLALIPNLSLKSYLT